MPLKIFVSYSHADTKIVDQIKSRITPPAFKYFDDRGIAPGQLLTESIQQNLVESNIFIVVISAAAMRSDWVVYELGLAKGMGKQVIPFLAPGVQHVPDYLRGYKAIAELDELDKFLNQSAVQRRDEPAAPRELLPIPGAIHEKLVKPVAPDQIELLRVPGEERLFSSFEPLRYPDCFLWLKVKTTPGRIPKNFNDPYGPDQRWENEILIIRDPIRPFEIQIGELRIRRPGGDPGVIELEGDLSLDTLIRMYPALSTAENKWMRMVLAEITSNPQSLKYIIEKSDNDPDVKRVAVRNPFAPNNLKRRECLFCNDVFKRARTVQMHKGESGSSAGDSYAICNDFPYGPHFHYIVAPSDPVHSWERIEEGNLLGMNLLMKELLESGLKKNGLNGSAGVRIGFNSSIRHLVMGKATRTSAGASIEHIHKQLWGMTPGAVNLGSHLHKVCRAYQEKVDYLQEYLGALGEADMILWQDRNVALYVPFGQASIHELQIMIKRAATNTYLDLNEREIRSLSKAEFFVTRLYQAMNINSFNEILITLPFGVEDVRNFRLILTFMTRQVDLAMSELNLLYVVDKDPFASVAELREKWKELGLP